MLNALGYISSIDVCGELVVYMWITVIVTTSIRTADLNQHIGCIIYHSQNRACVSKPHWSPIFDRLRRLHYAHRVISALGFTTA